jgi:hypothetical protein
LSGGAFGELCIALIDHSRISNIGGGFGRRSVPPTATASGNE